MTLPWLRRGLPTLILSVTTALVATACSGQEAGTEPDSATTTPAAAAGNEALVSTETGTVGFNDFSEGTEKSFGIFVCVTDADVVLESVEPISVEGDIEVIGAVLYEADNAFVGAIHDFPPRGLSQDYLTEIPGATVATACDDDARSQVVVGANRTGDGGGVIEGIRINYEGGALEVGDYRIILCGDEGEYCENVNSQADPGTARSNDEL